ncbi:MAG: response regulator [Candidatus Delongbacteria bacterium]|nr:response regulator [Candidatus Delongbacteria bacterium]
MKNKVIIIDDDIDILNAYDALFRSKGFIVETAYNTTVGEKIISEFKPDLIILDVMMQEPDEGFVFAQYLLDSKINIPIIITSSIAKAGQEIFDMNIPNVKYILQKPVDLDELIKYSEKILSQ